MMTPWPSILLGQLGLSGEEWSFEIVISFIIVAIPTILMFTVFDQVRIARRGRVAGELLLRARTPRWMTIFSVAMILSTIVTAVAIAWVGHRAANTLSGFPMPPLLPEMFVLPLAFEFEVVAIVSICSLQFSIIGLELREHGIFHGRRFMPWDQVACGRWLKREGKLRLEFGNFYRLVRVREDDVGRTDELLRKYVEFADENDASRDASPRRRKLRRSSFQFRLRTLLLIFVFAALVLGVFSLRLERIRTSRQIGSQFEGAGAKVEYMAGRVWSVDFSPGNPNTPPASGRKITDDDLVAIGQLSEIVFLTLDGTDISDAGLAQLAPLKYLSSLDLNKTRVTDAGLKHLARLPKLISLELGDTQITDRALADLAGMTQLEYLGVSGTRMTPEGVKKLREALPNTRIDFTPQAAPNAK